MHLADEMQRSTTEEGHLDRAMYCCTSSFLFTQKMKTSFKSSEKENEWEGRME